MKYIFLIALFTFGIAQAEPQIRSQAFSKIKKLMRDKMSGKMSDKQEAVHKLYLEGMKYYYGRDEHVINLKKAKDYFDEADRYSHTWAAYELGRMYYHGHGVARDFSRAEGYFIEVAEQDHDNAIHYLGLIYYYGGYGVDKDLKTAKWYFENPLNRYYEPSIEMLKKF